MEQTVLQEEYKLSGMFSPSRLIKAECCLLVSMGELHETGMDTGRSSASKDMQLVTRILNFLGRVGGRSAGILESQVRCVECRGFCGLSPLQLAPELEHSLAWDSVKHIRFPMPFPEQTLEIDLDPLLPRILHLAEMSTDRKVKVCVLCVVEVTRRSPSGT